MGPHHLSGVEKGAGGLTLPRDHSERVGLEFRVGRVGPWWGEHFVLDLRIGWGWRSFGVIELQVRVLAGLEENRE